jgi:hypothetical protein
MMQNIAVVLRGHVRTWNYIYPLVFEFYDSISKNVDYYFSTYDLDSFKKLDKLTSTFRNKNLIKILSFKQDYMDDNAFHNSWTSPAFMAYTIFPYLNKNHQNNKYDAVFDSRPDIIPYRINDKSIILPEENYLYTTNIELHRSSLNQEYYPAIADHFLMSTVNTFYKMSYRYSEENLHSNQIQHIITANKYGTDICKLDWIDAVITRPNMCDFKNKNDKDEVMKLLCEWAMLSYEERKKIIQLFNLDEKDYLSSNNCDCKI